MNGERVAIYGAAGHTGAMVARELARRGYWVALGGRDLDRLKESSEVVDVSQMHEFELADSRRLAEFVADARVVVNCAGPFGQTAETLTAAALAAKSHYVDSTGEQPVVAGLLERFDEKAREAGVAVLPAVGFFGALSDLLVTATANEWTAVEEVTIAYALKGWKLTRGSRKAAAALAGRRYVYDNGVVEIRSGEPPSTTWCFMPPIGESPVIGEYPAPEVLTLPRHLGIGRLRVLMTTSTIAEMRLDGSHDNLPEAEREGSTFILEVEVNCAGETRRARASGSDIYGLSSRMLVEVVERLTRDEVALRGVLAPGSAFSPKTFLHSIPGVELLL